MDEDISLPKATLAKVIRDAMPAGMRVSGDTVDLLVHCCNEFVHVISTQSNVVSEREKRATISPEHVLRALEELGFESYVEGVTAGATENVGFVLPSRGMSAMPATLCSRRVHWKVDVADLQQVV